MDYEFFRTLTNKSGVPFRRKRSLVSPGLFATVLQDLTPFTVDVLDRRWKDVLPTKSYDILVCTGPAVDDYDNHVEFYQKLADSCQDYLFLETDLNFTMCSRLMEYFGLEHAKPLAGSLILFRRSEPIDTVGSKTVRVGDHHHTSYFSHEDMTHFRELYESRLRGQVCVPDITFIDDRSYDTPHLGDGLVSELMMNMGTMPIPETLKKRLGVQLVEFIRAMTKVGVAHRDLNPKNLVYDDEANLWVIDWDTAMIQPPGVRYDLTGEGLPSPKLTGNMCLFKSIKHKGIVYPSMAEVLGLTMGDFDEDPRVLL